MTGKFLQGNNRYVVEISLYDYSVPVFIPENADVAVDLSKLDEKFGATDSGKELNRQRIELGGEANAMTFVDQGYIGYFLPLQNSAGYEFVSHHETLISGITVRDNDGGVSVGVKDVTFDESFSVEDTA